MINIDDLTLGQIKEIQAFTNKSSKSEISLAKDELLNKKVIIRTVTMIYTGILVEVTKEEFVLIKCSWIPETDRYMSFVAEGKTKECEPFPEELRVRVNRGALMERCELKSQLPRSQK